MNTDFLLLNEVYQNSITAIDALSMMLKKSREERVINCIFEQMQDYRKIANDAIDMMREYDYNPKGRDALEKSGLYIAVNVIGAGNISSKRIAKILINGSTEGIFNITNYINSCTDASKKSRYLAYELIKIEEKNILKMYDFL